MGRSTVGTNGAITIRDSQNEVRDLFIKLRLWREDSQKQFANILSYHDNKITKSMNDLVEEVSFLKVQLSSVTDERKVLLETVDSLNCEIRHLNEKLIAIQNTQETRGTDDTDDVEGRQICEKEESVDFGRSERNIQDPNINCDLDNEENLAKSSWDESVSANMDEVKLKDEELIEDLTVLNYSTQQKIDLTRQIISVHKTKEKKFKCNKCSYVSAYNRALYRHIRSVHDKIKSHVCNDCGYAASEKSSLEEHRQSKHIKGEKRYKCNICPFESHFRGYLSKHVKIKHVKN